MSQTVSILLKLRDKKQSHYFEKYLRQMFYDGEVISYENLPNTDHLKDDPVYKKLVANAKKVKRERDNYIFR